VELWDVLNESVFFFPSPANAAVGGHYEVVNLLLRHGADAWDRDVGERTPLMLGTGYEFVSKPDPPVLEFDASSATKGGHEAVVRRLVAAGSEIDAVDLNHCTALFYAVCANKRDVVSSLLQQGASVDIADTDGQTPLMCAAFKGYEEIVRMLLDAGADVKLKECNGLTALDLAVKRSHRGVEAMLRAASGTESTAT